MINPQFARFARSPSPAPKKRFFPQISDKSCVRLKTSSNSYKRLKKSRMFDTNLVYVHRLKDQPPSNKAQTPIPVDPKCSDIIFLQSLVEHKQGKISSCKKFRFGEIIKDERNEKSGFEGSEKKFRSKLSEAVQDENMKVFTKEKKLKRSRLLAKREKKITEHKAIQAIDDEEICPWGQLV